MIKKREEKKLCYNIDRFEKETIYSKITHIHKIHENKLYIFSPEKGILIDERGNVYIYSKGNLIRDYQEKKITALIDTGKFLDNPVPEVKTKGAFSLIMDKLKM